MYDYVFRLFISISDNIKCSLVNVLHKLMCNFVRYLQTVNIKFLKVYLNFKNNLIVKRNNY